MTAITKAILATFFYITGIELLGFWIFIPDAFEFDIFFKYYLLIQGVLQLTGIIIFIYFIKKQVLKNLINKTYIKWYLIALLLGTSFVFMQTPLNWIYNFFFGTDYIIAYRFDGFPKFKNVNLISSFLLIPIGEELFFREYIQNNLQKKMYGFVALFLASILFASIHSPYLNLIFESSNQDWHLFYITIFGGIISGILYYYSKSIGPSMIFHIFWNLMAIIV